jgi:hypothetical protein
MEKYLDGYNTEDRRKQLEFITLKKFYFVCIWKLLDGENNKEKN